MKNGCTAIALKRHGNVVGNWECKLYGCPIPVPPPGESKSHWVGYKLINGKLKSNISIFDVSDYIFKKIPNQIYCIMIYKH